MPPPIFQRGEEVLLRESGTASKGLVSVAQGSPICPMAARRRALPLPPIHERLTLLSQAVGMVASKLSPSLILVGPPGLGIMPGTGLCRAVGDLPLNSAPEWSAARHNPPQAIGCFCDGEFTIRLLNDTIINLTCKRWGARQRRPPFRAHRAFPGETGRPGLPALSGRISSAFRCKNRLLAASTKGAPMVAQ